jgi:cytochrome c peroxidase
MSAARVDLGRHLFYDRRLSGNGTQSCADCHRQELAFTDGRARAVGSTGLLHSRGAMALVNLAYQPAYGAVDPALRTLERQAREPLFGEDPVEMGARGHEAAIEARLAAEPRYLTLFPAAFPADPRPVRLDNAIHAIAAFQRTLVSGRSPYDRLVFDGDGAALHPAAREGMRLFFSPRLGCSGCHEGVGFGGGLALPDRAAEPLYVANGLGGEGLALTTGRPEDRGRFRVRTLRNVGVTAPYMHDGRLPTLEAVIRHYEEGGEPGAPRDPRMPAFRLTPAERAALVAFLESLTDEEFLRDPRYADPWP